MRFAHSFDFGLLVVIIQLTISAVCAESLDNLVDVTRHTVITNPDVRAANSTFESAIHERDAAKGAFRPRVDLEAGVAREHLDEPGLDSINFSSDAVIVTANQMLFDGFATHHEVHRLDHAIWARYYEVMVAAEDSAREAVRAYVDVLRQRALASLSEENYVTHRYLYEQINQRVNSGLSRHSESDQAGGRLALAESNLLTDQANLHDVSRRYQRVVGKPPAKNLSEPLIPDGALLKGISAALDTALDSGPRMKVAMAGVLEALAASERARAPMMPRLDFRARQEIWHNKDDVDGRYTEGVIELAGSYNVFNGFADSARLDQRFEEVSFAEELRNRACRDIRQLVAVSYYNTQHFKEQMIYHDRHQLAIAKTREAYRSEFELGQRTLLDILDAETEYYRARRSYIDAKNNQLIAKARTLSVMGALVDTLGLNESLLPGDQLPDIGPALVDTGSLCERETDNPLSIDKEAIFLEEKQRQGENESSG